MKRRIIRLGPSTLVMSLPRKWTKIHQIEAGRELEVSEEPQGLLIHPDEKQKMTE